MKHITKLTFLSIGIFILSCQPELSPEDYEFRGSWDSSKFALQIFKNGYGICDGKWRGRCEGNVRVKGRYLIFTADTDKSSLPRKKFRIDYRPSTDANGVTYMVLNGDRFEKH